MRDKTDAEILLEHVPALTIWYKLLLLYTFQIIIFILTIVFFWWISSIFLIGAIIGHSLVSISLVIYFIYMANNSDKIRGKYRRKYGKLAGQHFWYKYLSYINPIVSAAFYFSLLLKQDYYFFPAIISLPPHLFTNNIFPEYIAILLGLFIIIFGLLIRRPSGGYGIDVDSYLYMIYPEKGKLITDGIYKYIRNPQYLCRSIIAVGFGVVANNLLAIGVGIIHFLSYCAIIPAEDKELRRRFGTDFEEYRKSVPALFPKYGNWKKFIKYIFNVSHHQ